MMRVKRSDSPLLRVDLLPKRGYQDVVVVIDVLRSCTVAPILFDNGLKELSLCPSLRVARKLALERDQLLLGERRGLPPEGFNYGNSPLEFLRADVAGRSAVMVSENAPKTLSGMHEAKHVLLGSLYNAEAVVGEVLGRLTREVALVGAGFANAEDLDDAFTAGYLAARLKQRHGQLECQGATMMALSLLKAFPNPLDALWHSRAGHYLRHINLSHDIAVASFIDASTSVPVLHAVESYEGSPVHRFALP